MSDYTPFGPRSEPTDGLVSHTSDGPTHQPDPGRGPGKDRYHPGDRVRVDPDCSRTTAGMYGTIDYSDEDGIPKVDLDEGTPTYIDDDDLLPA